MAKALKIFALQFTGFVLFVFGAMPNVSHAATLLFSPSSATGTVGQPMTVIAQVNTGGVVSNAVDASISYPSSLSVSGLSKTGSVLSLWVTSPNASGGTISFTGGTPQPGFNGSALKLISITFVPQAAGTSTISFTGGSVLSGDGTGTELLSGLGSATFTINPAPAAPPKPAPGPAPSTPPPDIAHAPTPPPPTSQLPPPLGSEPTDIPEGEPALPEQPETIIIEVPQPLDPLYGLVIPLLAILFALLWGKSVLENKKRP